MNKFVLRALTLSAVSSLGFASTPDGEWLSLDRELANLSTSLNSTAAAGASVHGFLRTTLLNADEELVGIGDDATGFTVDNARLIFDAEVGAGYGVHISVDAAGGTATLVDAYGSFKINDMIGGKMGRFRAPFLWSGSLDENHLLFAGSSVLLNGRTLNGVFASGRDTGVMLQGSFDQFWWGASVQNGSDGLVDDLALAARVAFTAMGNSAGNLEGAYNANNQNNLTIGAGYYNDDSLPDGQAIGADVVFTAGQLYAHAEIADYDQSLGDFTPWTVTASWMLQPNQWELAGRFEDFDDVNDTTHFAAGVNYYVNGHDAKWGLEWNNFNSDGPVDGNAISLTLTVGV